MRIIKRADFQLISVLPFYYKLTENLCLVIMDILRLQQSSLILFSDPNFCQKDFTLTSECIVRQCDTATGFSQIPRISLIPDFKKKRNFLHWFFIALYSFSELPAQPEQQKQLQSGLWDPPVSGLHLWQHHRRTGPVGSLHQWEECGTHKPDCRESDWVLSRSLSRKPGDFIHKHAAW